MSDRAKMDRHYGLLHKIVFCEDSEVRKLEADYEKVVAQRDMAIEAYDNLLQDAESLYMQLQHAQDNPPPTVNYFKNERKLLRELSKLKEGE